MTFTLTDYLTKNLPVCACCNRAARLAGGVARRNGEPWIVYTVRWIPEMIARHGASIRLSFPAWEAEDADAERAEICLDFLHTPGRMGLFVVDAWGDNVLPGNVHGMTREEVIGSGFMEQVSEVMPLIWAKDENITELRQLMAGPEVETTGPSQSECEVPSTPPGSDPVAGTTGEPMGEPARLAQQNWPRFVTVFNAGEGESFQVKKEFVSGETREDLWLLVTSLDGDRVRGRVTDEPAHDCGAKQMDEVEFGANEVIDWLVIDDGEYYAGGYSIPDESPDARAVRVLADQNNLPTMLLHRFLTGLDLSQKPIGNDLASLEEKAWGALSQNLDQSAEDFSEAEVHDAFRADFHRIVLSCRTIQVDLWCQGLQREPLAVELSSDGAAGFSSGELLFKIHAAGLPFYSQVEAAYFSGLRFVYINEQGTPVYALMASSARGGPASAEPPPQ